MPPQANVVFAWHGCPSQFVENVCRDGPRALRFTDGGFFATGSYTALELDYATRYAMMHPPSTSGEYAFPPPESLPLLCTDPALSGTPSFSSPCSCPLLTSSPCATILPTIPSAPKWSDVTNSFLYRF
jgi:hypothetical protein